MSDNYVVSNQYYKYKNIKHWSISISYTANLCASKLQSDYKLLYTCPDYTRKKFSERNAFYVKLYGSRWKQPDANQPCFEVYLITT